MLIKKYFDNIEEVPSQALSMGIGSIMKSKKNCFDSLTV